MKTKKRVNEDLQILVVSEPNINIVADNMLAEWGGTLYSQLSVVLVYLKFLSELHQNHHWTCLGDPFYGDHLLFSRIYDGVKEQVDTVAEKAIGMGCNSNVDLLRVTSQVHKLVSSTTMGSTIPQSSELARKSLTAELTFLKILDSMIDSLGECGLLTNGVDNMLQDIADKHEGYVYLLKQRCSKGIM